MFNKLPEKLPPEEPKENETSNRSRSGFIPFLIFFLVCGTVFALLAKNSSPVVLSEKSKELVLSVEEVDEKKLPNSLADMTSLVLAETFAGLDKARSFRSSTWFSDYAAMKKQVKYYDIIHPFIYGIAGGNSNSGKLTSNWGHKTKLERVKELREINPRVLIVPTIFRWENPSESIEEVIGTKGRTDIRDKHIDIIMNEVLTYDFDGIDIDYEGMDCHKREHFESFIKILSKRLHAKNKMLAVSIHPKTNPSRHQKATNFRCKKSGKNQSIDFRERWRGPLAHDYKAMGRYADKVNIMAYELHPRKYRDPGPGPQAPSAWLKDILDYTVKHIPKRKIYMAIPTYGYDWALNCKNRAKAVYYNDARKLMSRPGVVRVQPTYLPKLLSSHSNGQNWFNLSPFKRNHIGKVYEDPTLWYRENGCDRVAFYMDTKAFRHKMEILRGYDIGGFSFWQLTSGNDPGINLFLEKLVKNQLPQKPYSLEELNAKLKPVVPTAFKQLGKTEPLATKEEPVIANDAKPETAVEQVAPAENTDQNESPASITEPAIVDSFPDEVEVTDSELQQEAKKELLDETVENQLDPIVNDI